jgi:uncharacterized RDD family membrane protein YckC
MTETGSPGDQGAPPSTGWEAPPPASTAPAAAVPGPAGFVYADVVNRVVAIIIDGIIIAVIIGVVQAILGAIGLSPYTADLSGVSVNVIGLLLYVIIGLAVSVFYFLLTWTRRRATFGMQILSLQIGNAVDGKTLTQDQAIRRWLALFGPSTLAQLFIGFSFIGWLISLAALAWVIFLLWTTAKSPTKQGWHDVFANTMIVKAARIAA